MTKAKTAHPATHVAHHFVPDFLLKNWHTALNKKLTHFQWTFGKLDVHEYKAKHVAKCDHLYSRVLQNGTHDNSLETTYFRDEVDNIAAPVLDKICNHGVSLLTEDDRRIWTRFLAAQLARTPSMIQSFRENSTQDFQSGVDEIASRPGRESFRKYVEHNARFAAYNIAVEILPAVIANPELNSLIHDAAWDVIDLSSASFDLLIGDHPIVKIKTAPDCNIMALPITPKSVLCLASSESLIVQIRKVSTSQLVKILNKSTVLQADQYVYSTGRLHTEFIRKHLRR